MGESYYNFEEMSEASISGHKVKKLLLRDQVKASDMDRLILKKMWNKQMKKAIENMNEDILKP